MKSTKSIFLLMVVLVTTSAQSQERTALNTYWQIGIGLGELPMDGSFKPSISVGYHFNEKLYAGFIYQFPDKISRNESSFNVKSSRLEGLTSSSEKVAQRLLLQVRYTPIKNGPYLSGGFVFNGKDTETMNFDSRTRIIGDDQYDGTITIQQTRPAGWGLALGLGYQYNFKNGLSAGFEWTPAWGQYPTPFYQFSGSSNLTFQAENTLQTKMDKGFKESVTNLYKVFHIGVAYRFQ